MVAAAAVVDLLVGDGVSPVVLCNKPEFSTTIPDWEKNLFRIKIPKVFNLMTKVRNKLLYKKTKSLQCF
jgi:hypothetical protein